MIRAVSVSCGEGPKLREGRGGGGGAGSMACWVEVNGGVGSVWVKKTYS
jgi:hypothetical protein